MENEKPQPSRPPTADRVEQNVSPTPANPNNSAPTPGKLVDRPSDRKTGTFSEIPVQKEQD